MSQKIYSIATKGIYRDYTTTYCYKHNCSIETVILSINSNTTFTVNLNSEGVITFLAMPNVRYPCYNSFSNHNKWFNIISEQ